MQRSDGSIEQQMTYKQQDNGINPNISILSLNINDPNTSIKSQRLSY